MKATEPATPVNATLLLCEIRAPRATAADLERITRFCAAETGQSLDVLAREVNRGQALITLHLPVEHAASQHPAWCLACRLACFCPDARVSVLVRAESEFRAANGRAKTRRRSA